MSATPTTRRRTRKAPELPSGEATLAEAPKPETTVLEAPSPEVDTRDVIPEVDDVPFTEVTPAEAIPTVPSPEAVAVEPRPLEIKIPCPKCKGTGQTGHARQGGKCFRCAHDQTSPAKGFMDHVDLERNRRFDLRGTRHLAVLTLQADVGGEKRTRAKEFAASGEVYVRTAEGVKALPAKDVKEGMTILLARLGYVQGQKDPVAVAPLEAAVLAAKEVVPQVAF
jgi:hypothetical protein